MSCFSGELLKRGTAHFNNLSFSLLLFRIINFTIKFLNFGFFKGKCIFFLCKYKALVWWNSCWFFLQYYDCIFQFANRFTRFTSFFGIVPLESWGFLFKGKSIMGWTDYFGIQITYSILGWPDMSFPWGRGEPFVCT